MGCRQSNLSTARLDPSLCSTTPFRDKYARRVAGLTEERFLGQGEFGRVVLIEDKHTRDTYALKIIAKRRRTGGDEKLLESLRTEITILREYGRHENILQLRDVYDRPTSVLLVEELATGGDLVGLGDARAVADGTSTPRFHGGSCGLGDETDPQSCGVPA